MIYSTQTPTLSNGPVRDHPFGFLLTGDGEGGGEGEGGEEEVCLPPQERKRGGRSKKAKKKFRSVTRLAEVTIILDDNILRHCSVHVCSSL